MQVQFTEGEGQSYQSSFPSIVFMLLLANSGFGEGLSDRGARCDDGRGADEQRRVHAAREAEALEGDCGCTVESKIHLIFYQDFNLIIFNYFKL